MYRHAIGRVGVNRSDDDQSVIRFPVALGSRILPAALFRASRSCIPILLRKISLADIFEITRTAVVAAYT
jgi:hypothetical protein